MMPNDPLPWFLCGRYHLVCLVNSYNRYKVAYGTSERDIDFHNVFQVLMSYRGYSISIFISTLENMAFLLFRVTGSMIALPTNNDNNNCFLKVAESKALHYITSKY